MIHYQLDYVIEEVNNNMPTAEQTKLKDLVGENFTRAEAKYVWERVVDHKWYVGERLKRDIGWRVAAIDYVENFYDPAMFRKNNQPKGFFKRTFRSVSNLTRNYFVSKSKTLPGL